MSERIECSCCGRTPIVKRFRAAPKQGDARPINKGLCELCLAWLRGSDNGLPEHLADFGREAIEEVAA